MGLDLCQPCQAFSVSDLDDTGHLMHNDVSILRRNASTGEGPASCGLCNIVWTSLGLDDKAQPLRSPADFHVRLYRNPPRVYGHDQPVRQVDIIVAPPRRFDEFAWQPESSGLYPEWRIGPPDTKRDIFRSHLTVYAGLAKECRHEDVKFAYRLMETNSGSAACVGMIADWLSECSDTHGDTCPYNADSALPSRLVDVGPPDGSIEPRLVITDGQTSGTYLALSYCWGTASFFKLTPENLQGLQESIPLGDVPATIRDAILLTRRLGFRHLWVDSLCIIQGQSEVAVRDWQKESPKMATVYGGARLTIAATMAKACDVGLFHDRAQPRRSQQPVPAERESKEVVYLGSRFSEPREDAEPLNGRGWVFQEALLSRRLVSFGTSELSWCCAAGRRRERLTTPRRNDGFTANAGGRSGQQHSRLYTSWKDVIEEYSARTLTRVTDRLPAISGLAELAMQGTQDSYHYGILGAEARDMIMWKHRGRYVDGKVSFTRANPSTAPSWSWASVGGQIQFLPRRVCDPDSLGVSTSFNMMIRDRSIMMKGRLLKVETLRLQTEGQYYGGYDRYMPWTEFPSSMKTFIDDLQAVPEVNRMEISNGTDEMVKVWLFFVGWEYGLILVPTEAHEVLLSRPGTWLPRLGSARQWLPWSRFMSYGPGQLGRKFVRIGAFTGFRNARGEREKRGKVRQIELL